MLVTATSWLLDRIRIATLAGRVDRTVTGLNCNQAPMRSLPAGQHHRGGAPPGQTTDQEKDTQTTRSV